ncbi:828_t:CDS:2, partial [Gigaspora margarita]
FEIDDMKLDHLNEQYYLINVNNAEYSLFECDEEESWLKEFIDAFKHIQKNIVGISIESMTETEWYIDVLNLLLKTLVSGL